MKVSFGVAITPWCYCDTKLVLLFHQAGVAATPSWYYCYTKLVTVTPKISGSSTFIMS